MDAKTDDKLLPSEVGVSAINVTTTDGYTSIEGAVMVIGVSKGAILSLVADGLLISVPLAKDQALDLGRALLGAA